ncbi:MAG TPA: bifunctional UDP-N-acetylglucosamine diphosphorylase/glucosamine-1-phosphate N-acetyltransferase GlmU [Terracidiphilus sp.]|nr:bifunctional UDP-N-acetylglucosamine diphosphorylase/glucosamine-1-phosphate N-acetyltransferase GlmU [Terracidiphilus sp.]
MSKERGGPNAATGAKPAVVIMAAGKGTRLKSRRPKVLHEIGGKPLICHVIAAASQFVEPGRIFVVVGHQADRVREAVSAAGVQFVDQAEQRGTGHAIQCAAQSIAGFSDVLVLSGDVPLIRRETMDELWRFHKAEGAAMTILSAAPENPFGYGRVVRESADSADVEAVVEQSDLAANQESIPEINSGIYVFGTKALLEQIGNLKPDNTHGELYLTDMAAVLRRAGERVVAVQADHAAEVLGANTIAELVALDATMRASHANRLMAMGVTIYKPESCVIDAEVEVEADTIIEPYVQLLGRTKIGGESRIRSYSVIENCTIGSGVLVRQGSVLVESTVSDRATIGPFSHLRPGSEIGENAHVGNFVETKNARLGKGTKANHLTYLGDAEIGAGTNIGAGTITCNYDGVHKNRTQIGEGAFVGSDSTLVAPVVIGDGAYVGAGSCITRDVPPGALAVGRSRQVTKEGWATARRARQKAELESAKRSRE